LDDLLAEKGERLFHTNKVREYLFDGVSIESYMELLSLPVTQFTGGKKIQVPKRLMDGDFGFFDDVRKSFIFPCHLSVCLCLAKFLGSSSAFLSLRKCQASYIPT